MLLQAKVAPGALHLTPRAALVIDGRDIEVRNLRLDGALIVRAVPGAHVLIDGLSVSNAGWEWASLDRAAAAGGAPPTPEEAMRGFRVLRHDTLTLQFDAPGEYHVPPPSPTGGKET
jgi:UDP-sugar pyrophosphorylase